MTRDEIKEGLDRSKERYQKIREELKGQIRDDQIINAVSVFGDYLEQIAHAEENKMDDLVSQEISFFNQEKNFLLEKIKNLSNHPLAKTCETILLSRNFKFNQQTAPYPNNNQQRSIHPNLKQGVAAVVLIAVGFLYNRGLNSKAEFQPTGATTPNRTNPSR